MGLDAQLKRWWWAVVASMIAVTALLQAAGVGRMVAAALTSAGSTEAPKLPPSKAAASSDRERSGAPILARNIFDSQTGPLDDSAKPAVSASATPEPVPVEIPPVGDLSEDAPACDTGKVVLISASDDPSWSFAAIDDGTGKTQLRRNGQEIGGYTVRAMAWNRVWLEQAGK
ncbi:MAG: general secretion pathway protein GspC, partial [Deltaproteobacteria bacterium]|nr:general secretion pathway protein GspC [Deltaproteobacteria bacterium]